MSNPYKLPPIFLQLTLDEAFCFAKLQLPEDLPPEWYSAVAKVNLAIKVARHVETGLPLSEPLWEEPAPVPPPEPPRKERISWEDIPPGVRNELCGRFWDDV
jgi:hypothetical protein